MSARTMATFSALIPLLLAAPVFAKNVPSRPQRATVFRDGTAVLVEQLEPSAAAATIELPAAALPAPDRLQGDQPGRRAR